MGVEGADYPYWLNEFQKEFKGLQVFYREDDWPAGTDDMADSYRVFMILCNQNSNMARMEVLAMLKNATEETPIKYQGETFWTEKE